MSGPFDDDYDEAPRPLRRSRFDLVTLAVALLALGVALHARLYPRAVSLAGDASSLGDVEQRLQAIEDSLFEMRATLGAPDRHARSVNDRMLVVENQHLLLDETLAKIVGHVKSLEESVRAVQEAR
jgi:hypothetical protein